MLNNMNAIMNPQSGALTNLTRIHTQPHIFQDETKTKHQKSSQNGRMISFTWNSMHALWKFEKQEGTIISSE